MILHSSGIGRLKQKVSIFVLFVVGLILFGLLSLARAADNSGDSIGNKNFAKQKNRIIGLIDDNDRVTLSGNRHPRVARSTDLGRAKDTLHIDHMILSLTPDASQNEALERYMASTQDPHSANFSKWLSAQEFEQNFGVSDQDINKVVQWLTTHGFTVDEIPAGHRSIVFSGTVAQIRNTFHTEMHHLKFGSEPHLANMSDPEIPDALSAVIGGIVSLHDFRSKPMHSNVQPAPAYTSGSSHAMAPADFYTIYNLKPVAAQSINGAGRSIAILGRTNILMSDIQKFQTTMGLPANLPQVVLNGTNPGRLSGDEGESDLDLEWAGAVAPGATIKFVTSKSTASTDGIDLSAQYAVSNNVADIISLSYGLCEADLGSSAMSFYNNLWQQATAQGMTVFVSSGDSGAADCDAGSTTATRGRAVNGLCSSQYSTCVGGTQFDDTANPALYWSTSNNANDLSSALSYIPEVVWNESGTVSGGSELWASGGGASNTYTKPSWQIGLGIPADGKRDVPDVALTAASHDGYLVYSSDNTTNTQTRYTFGGTSASAPSFAGLMALINQKTGYRQGNANPRFYQLAALQASGGPAYFHQITSGNNSVPGQTGFSASAATPYYNQATGLGSVDGNVLINHWTDVLPASTTTVVANVPSISLGQSVTFTVTVAGGSTSVPMGTVQFKDGANNLGSTIVLSGATASYSTSALAIGSHSITAIYSGDVNNNASVSGSLIFNVNKYATAVSVSSTSASATYGQTVNFTTTISGARSPTGTLTWMDGTTSLGSVSVNGCVASFSISTLSVGTHNITVVYSGDANNQTSTSSVFTETIAPLIVSTNTTLVSSSNTSTFGQNINLTATVNGQSPTGTVEFFDESISLGSVALNSETALLTLSSLAVGTHNITAVYSGDANNSSSTSAVSIQVVQAPVVVSDGDVPTLPEWAAILMALLLAFINRRNFRV